MTARESATKIAQRLIEAGYTTYFAGGCVRDQLRGHPPKDYDLATSATPTEVTKLFPGANQVGAHFGVVIAKLGGHAIEVATFRTDGSYADGRRPDSVTFATPEEDATRRDFTINGLFQHPLSGEIIDYVDGQSDLQQRLIRAINDPLARFREDALRLLRAIRFAATLDFQIDDTTWQAICELAPSLTKISTERIRDEFSRMLISPYRGRALQLLTNSGLLGTFLPEALDLIDCTQPPQWHPEGDVYTHTRMVLDALGENPSLELCLAALLHDIAKPATRTVDESDGRIRFNGHDKLGATMATQILRRLKYPNRTIDEVTAMVSRHMHFMHVQDMRPAKLKRFMSAPTFPDELKLHLADCQSSNGFTDNYEFLTRKREEFAAEPLIPEPLITGRDLINHGFTPGPLFKKILNTAQTEQLEGQLTNRHDALQWLKQQRKS